MRNNQSWKVKSHRIFQRFLQFFKFFVRHDGSSFWVRLINNIDESVHLHVVNKLSILRDTICHCSPPLRSWKAFRFGSSSRDQSPAHEPQKCCGSWYSWWMVCTTKCLTSHARSARNWSNCLSSRLLLAEMWTLSTFVLSSQVIHARLQYPPAK